MRKLSFILVLTLAGCGTSVEKNPEPVTVSGRVLQGGRPVTEVVLNLQPVGSGTQAAIPVKAGAFQGQVTPGRYTYYLSQTSKPGSFPMIPQKYHAGSLERQIEIAAGSTLEVTLD